MAIRVEGARGSDGAGGGARGARSASRQVHHGDVAPGPDEAHLAARRARPGLVRSIGVFRPLQLDLQSFHANLKPIHGLNSGLCRGWVVK